MTTPENEQTAEQVGSEQASSRQTSDTIHSPYDRLLNRTLQKVEVARKLVESHLPREIVQHFKLETLAHVDTSFVDRNLRRRFADRLLSVELSDEIVDSLGMKTKYAYVLVLVEHKSTDDRKTLVQILSYIVRIWENALENNQPLMPIIPWVIYNGVSPWRSARSLDELIPVPQSWKRYVPGLELAILDISRMEDAAMVGEPVLQVALTLLKYGREPELEMVLRPMLKMLSQTLTLQQAKNFLDTVRIYVMSVNPVLGEEEINAMASEIWSIQPEPGSVADQILQKGKALGEEIGEARGEAREKSNTIRILQSILGVPQATDEELAAKSLEDLQATIESLQQQILQRQS